MINLLSIFKNWKFIVTTVITVLLVLLYFYVDRLSSKLREQEREISRLHIERKVNIKDEELKRRIMERFIKYQKEKETIRKEFENEQSKSKEKSIDKDSYIIFATDSNISK